MNSLLYAANTIAQTLTAGQYIGFGVPVRRYGRNIQMSGGNVTIDGEGYYPIIANVTGIAAAAGIVSVQLYENGVPIPGAIASATVAADDTFAVAIPTAVRIKCCEEKVVTAQLLTVGAEITNASILVEKA